jgi:ketosteroid isomerase-like protein
MSQENVEVVERVFDAVARHDTEAVLDAYDPDIEYDFSGSPLGGLIGDTVYRGHDGMRRWVRDHYEA